MDDFDAYAAALGLELRLARPALLRQSPVTLLLALMKPSLVPERLRLRRQAAAHYSAVWCWVISFPNRAAALAAFGSSSAVNSKDRPAGAPLTNTGSGLALW